MTHDGAPPAVRQQLANIGRLSAGINAPRALHDTVFRIDINAIATPHPFEPLLQQLATGHNSDLADHTLKGAFRHIDSTQARVIPLDPAPAKRPPMGEKLGKKAQARLEKMGVEIQLGAMVTDVDRNGITVKDSDGTIRRI